jgi:hypothetical protein
MSINPIDNNFYMSSSIYSNLSIGNNQYIGINEGQYIQGQTEAGDVNQNDIQQLQDCINQDKPLENAVFDSNFKIEKVPQELTKNFTQTLTKFDGGISQLTGKILGLKKQLTRLLSRIFRPWSLIREIRQQIKIFTEGLKNLKNLKSKFLNQKSKTEIQTNQLINQFTSNNHAKDALYNKGANLI